MTKRKAQDVEQPILLPVEKPEPTDAERTEVRDYLARAKTRRRAPRFAVERQPGKPVRLNQTQVHPGVAAVRMMNALGTTSVDLADRLVGQILNATHLQPPGQPISEQSLNAALAAVTGIGPRDEAEAMLAAQMVGVHWTAMELLHQVGGTGNRLQLNDAGNLAVKLLRTYTAQIEALKRYRSAGEQRVVVQHVNVMADQAAVQVNPMSTPQGEGAVAKTEDQPHAQAVDHVSAHASVGSLRGPDPARGTVPAAGCGRS
jgi:hypothetical protein